MSEFKVYQHIGQLVESTPQMRVLYPTATRYVLAADYDRALDESHRNRVDFVNAVERCDALKAELKTFKAQQHGEPVAQVANKYGDPETFAERQLIIDDKALQSLPTGTKLYTTPQTIPGNVGVRTWRYAGELNGREVYWIEPVESGDGLPEVKAKWKTPSIEPLPLFSGSVALRDLESAIDRVDPNVRGMRDVLRMVRNLRAALIVKSSDDAPDPS